MKYGNILATALVICLCTALVVVFAFLRPEQALIIVIVYLSTIVIMSILMYIIERIYTKHKTSVDTEDFVKVAENLGIEFILWSDDFSFISFNKRLRDELGIDEDSNPQDALRKAFGIDSLSEDTIKPIIGEIAYNASFKNPSGKTTSIAWSTSAVKKIKKRTIYVSTGFNLTEIKKMKVNLASANDFFNASMELAEIGVVMSTDRKKYAASSETVRMFGLKKNSIDINTFRNLIHPNDRMQFDTVIKDSNDEISEVRNLELRIRPANKSTYRWYAFRYKSIKGTDNTLPLFGGAILDITEEREKDMLIERLAYTDEVTEISNRNKLVDIGQETYECCQPLNCSYWVLVFDIDRFHIINDTCGYNNGNYILKNFAHILYKFVTPGGIAARLSGDNFALILKNYGDDELPVRTAKSIQEEFAKLAVGEFNSISLSCSAGFSKMPDDGNSFLDILEHAEFALKSVSGQTSTICGYEPSMHDSIIGNTELEKALALAIDNNELQLFYQPKIDLKTKKIMGVEALIRWIKPDGTIITPNVFVPIAESSHLIGKISEFVLNEGCRQNILWQKMGYPNIVMSINFTSTDFYQADLKEKVFEALAKSGLDPEWLEVELTETLALSDVDYAISQMNKLRELGVKLAMDDFGTGYSSLSYLQILPITLLKLDRSFIINIQNDNIAHEIVSAVISIAKSKKIKTIAEGIENTEQEDILREMGCDYGQGYLYGKPMPAQQLEELMESLS
ncbi:MAG: GGDEF and EAL domain-containing protein [Ruminococcus flavefaciens]|nr:GGDEF and EAL domain-containing protein [Ruminococcus flavefaciens]MCM1229595.1 GGDEF and EAL domain-containing protein [Ruminococcus flavefaciens]